MARARPGLLPQGSVVLVTGASSGLGLALSRRLVASPYRAILTARAESLPRLAAAGIHAGERVRLRALDVTSSVERRAVVGEAERDWGGVDALVNNAGVAFRSVLEHVQDDERLEQLDVNFLAPMELVRLVLPGMRAKRRGRIVNVSSVGGMMAMPTMAVYSASKFALEGASEALWYEVRPWGIAVTLVEPGFIHSPSFQNTRYTAESARALDESTDPYHAHYQRMAPFIARLMDMSRSTPATVANRILDAIAMRDPPLRMSGTPDAFLFSMLRRILPRRLYHAVLYRALPRVQDWGPS